MTSPSLITKKLMPLKQRKVREIWILISGTRREFSLCFIQSNKSVDENDKIECFSATPLCLYSLQWMLFFSNPSSNVTISMKPWQKWFWTHFLLVWLTKKLKKKKNIIPGFNPSLSLLFLHNDFYIVSPLKY